LNLGSCSESRKGVEGKTSAPGFYHKEIRSNFINLYDDTRDDKLLSTGNMREVKKLDIFVMILLPIVALVISLLVSANFFISTLLFLGLPTIYLTFRAKPMAKKASLFSLIFSIPAVVILDYIATVSKAWYVPTTIFPFRLFDIIPLEDFIWTFLFIYLVALFYEYFFQKGAKELTSLKVKPLLYVSATALVVFFILYFINPDFLYVKYAYFWIGLVVFVVPTIVFLSFYPKLLFGHLKMIPYFCFLLIIHELVASHLRHWEFPGTNYIGWINFFGIPIPFEEFFYVFFAGAIGITTYYELFDNKDRLSM